ncbi:MAG TPA: hypothetical protein EYP43_02290, partial [Thermoplasmata archaeon]|nr:hypothetical protein [Thermoplasmata archaeon]
TGYDVDGDGIGEQPYMITTFLSPANGDIYPWGEFAPTLRNCTVTPERGSATTVYMFTVNYTDAEGRPAEVVRIYVNGTSYNMTPALNGSWTDGWTFYFNTTNITLAPGYHMVDYTAFDGLRWGTCNCSSGPYINQPPTLSNGTVTPATGSSHEVFRFSVNLTDVDNDTADRVLLHIGVESLEMAEEDPTDNETDDGKWFYVLWTPAPGNHTFNFSAYDGWEWSASDVYIGPYVNHPAEIVNRSVVPEWGDNTTNFSFAVTYRDVETTNATSIYITFDWGSSPMEWAGSDPAENGSRYVFHTVLDFGLHNYSYMAFDGVEFTTVGPFQIKVNRAPVLLNGTIFPTEGNSSVLFTFNVTYRDGDGDPPSWVRVNIDNVSFQMTLVTDGEANHTNGTLYTYMTYLLAGNHTFNFSASDGYATVWLAGGTISINQSDIPVQPIAYIDTIDPELVRSNGTVHLAGHGSGGVIVEYEWASDVDGLLGNTSSVEVGDLTPGRHNITLRVRNDDDLWSEPANGTFYVNHPPSIPLWMVSPEWGNATTAFNFTAGYLDHEDENATAFYLTLDGVRYPMDYGGWCPCTGGVRYTVNMTLPYGNHTFNFSASDGLEWTASDPGFVKVNRPPTLVNGSVDPLEGNTTIPFTFRLTYTDPDGDAPWEIDVVIDGTGYPMTPLDPDDTDYTDGAVYTYTTPLEAGNHTYNFTATDWYENATLEGGSIEVQEGGGPIKPFAYIDRISPNPAAPGEKVHFAGRGAGGAIVDYEWRSDIDGPISDRAEFNRSSLSVGEHNISFRVRNEDLWSDWVYASLSVVATAPLPDIKVSTLTIIGEDIAEGDAVTMVLVLVNEGNASGNFTIGLYVHPANTTFTSPADLDLIRTFTVTIGADDTKDITLNWTAVEGDLELVVWADPDDAVAELRENNNVLTRSVFVAPTRGGGEGKEEAVDMLVGAGMFLLIVVIVVGILLLIRRPRTRMPRGPHRGVPDKYGPSEYGRGEAGPWEPREAPPYGEGEAGESPPAGDEGAPPEGQTTGESPERAPDEGPIPSPGGPP